MKGLPRSRARGPALRNSIIRQPILLNVTCTITDPGSANAPFTGVVGDLPEGNILLHGAAAYPILTRVGTNLAATFGGNLAFGSAPTADATLNGAEVDLLASTALQAAVSGVSSGNRMTNATQVVLDNTDGSLEINVNGFIADASISGNDSVIVTGNLLLLYSMLLDD